MLTVGRILKAHGIKGEIKVDVFADDLSFLKKLPGIMAGGAEYKVESVKFSGGFGILKLGGVDTPEAAERLRGLEIKTDKNDAPALPEGRFYIADLIGCTVYAGGDEIGTLYDILQYSVTDVYCVKGERNVMFPLADGVFSDADVPGKKVFIDKKRFEEVAVYED